MGNFLFIIYELINNVIGLIRIIIYYLIESLIFGLVMNILWNYLFKMYFDFNISYLHFVSFLIIYRLIFFDVIKHNQQNSVEYSHYESEERSDT